MKSWCTLNSINLIKIKQKKNNEIILIANFFSDLMTLKYIVTHTIAFHLFFISISNCQSKPFV